MSVTVHIEAPSDAAACPSHPEHKRWVKQTLFEDECQRQQELGVIPDTRAIEEDIHASLQRIYARERETDKRPPPLPQQRDARDDPAGDMAEESGWDLYRGSENLAQEKPALAKIRTCKLQCGGQCVECRLDIRIRALMEQRWAGWREGLKREPVYPRFFREILTVYVKMRTLKGEFRAARGQGRRRRYRTINRIANRQLQDIADRSRPFLGEWRGAH